MSWHYWISWYHFDPCGMFLACGRTCPGMCNPKMSNGLLIRTVPVMLNTFWNEYFSITAKCFWPYLYKIVSPSMHASVPPYQVPGGSILQLLHDKLVPGVHFMGGSTFIMTYHKTLLRMLTQNVKATTQYLVWGNLSPVVSSCWSNSVFSSR